MTAEEKAKAYDEAIKKAKEIKEKIVYSYLSTESCKAVSEYIDTIIPELRESEDEKIRKEIIDFLETIPASELKRIPRPISEWFSYLAKQKEQKPAEWSEEDEKIMETMIRDGNLKQSECAWLRFQVKERLKSLRHWPDWKPSEEQMRALIDIICFGKISYVGQEEELIALKNQLKKLM